MRFYYNPNKIVIREAMASAGLAPAAYDRYPNDRCWCSTPGYVLRVARPGMSGDYTGPALMDEPEDIQVWYDAPDLASLQYLGRLSDYLRHNASPVSP